MPGPMLNPTVGVRIAGDSAEVNPRANRTGELATAAAHGTWLEPIRRGNLWTIATPTAGITVTANMLVSVASANAIVGVYNNGQQNVHITRAEVIVASAATATGFVWGYNSPTVLAVIPTGVTHSTNHNLLNTGTPPGVVAFDGTVAVSGAAVTFLLRPIVGGAINTLVNVEEFDDDLWVPPNGFLGIFGDTVTTATVVKAALTFEVVPL